MRWISLISSEHSIQIQKNVFSSAHWISSRIDHILGHKSNLSKFKKIEIISSIFSDFNAMRLDSDYKKKNCNESPVQVWCTILEAWGWCTGMTQRNGTGRKEGSGRGTRVYLWWIHVDIWQNQDNIVKLKNKIKKITFAY